MLNQPKKTTTPLHFSKIGNCDLHEKPPRIPSNKIQRHPPHQTKTRTPRQTRQIPPHQRRTKPPRRQRSIKPRQNNDQYDVPMRTQKSRNPLHENRKHRLQKTTSIPRNNKTKQTPRRTHHNNTNPRTKMAHRKTRTRMDIRKPKRKPPIPHASKPNSSQSRQTRRPNQPRPLLQKHQPTPTQTQLRVPRQKKTPERRSTITHHRPLQHAPDRRNVRHFEHGRHPSRLRQDLG